MRVFCILMLLIFSFLAFAHEGHAGKITPASESTLNEVKETIQEEHPTTWTQKIGSLHLISLHFPIALINMLAISECLFIWYRRPMFEFSSKFLLVSAAITAPPTALLGLIYSYTASYSGLMETFLLWHMWLGIGTAIFTIIVAVIRERIGISKFYYASLVILILMINATGFIGGEMTFGTFLMHDNNSN